jgi:hypothetical protein
VKGTATTSLSTASAATTSLTVAMS